MRSQQGESRRWEGRDESRPLSGQLVSGQLVSVQLVSGQLVSVQLVSVQLDAAILENRDAPTHLIDKRKINGHCEQRLSLASFD